MKKKIVGPFLLLIALFISQCGCKPASTTSKTLNDVDGVIAGEMIQHFADLKANDNAPVTESFWISKEMIHDIVALLHKEITVEKEKQVSRSNDPLFGITDGVRIYFASDPAVSTYPLSNTILLVSTRDNGKAPKNWKGCKSGRRHLDYYEHSSTADLFKLSNHEIKCVSAGCPGDSLYIPTNSAGPVCTLPHDIPRPEAEEMVQYFLQKHTINTMGEWFDLGFFETIDKSNTPNGIRIYFARHKICKEDASKSYRDAFVITTTRRDPKTGITVDYFDRDTDNNIASAYEKTFFNKYHILNMPPSDNAELCPDNCN